MIPKFDADDRIILVVYGRLEGLMRYIFKLSIFPLTLSRLRFGQHLSMKNFSFLILKYQMMKKVMLKYSSISGEEVS